jgi:nicotinamidase-related amidase
MLLERNKSAVVLVDVQEKLLPAINDGGAVLSRCQWLLALATKLSVPVVVSEQYPQGLGPTCSSLLQTLSNPHYIDKTLFSCAKEKSVSSFLEEHGIKQIILIGIEAHVCVLQSGMEFIQQGYDVFMVEDATGSRKAVDKAVSIERLRQQGVQIVTAEMVLFEWLRNSDDKHFRSISKEFLQ